LLNCVIAIAGVSERIEIYNQMLEKGEAWVNFKVKQKKAPHYCGAFC
jgi:hypothetical protein